MRCQHHQHADTRHGSVCRLTENPYGDCGVGNSMVQRRQNGFWTLLSIYFILKYRRERDRERGELWCDASFDVEIATSTAVDLLR